MAEVGRAWMDRGGEALGAEAQDQLGTDDQEAQASVPREILAADVWTDPCLQETNHLSEEECEIAEESEIA